MLITGIIVNMIIMITIIIAAIFPCRGALIALLLYVSASVTALVLMERRATLVGEVYSDRTGEATSPREPSRRVHCDSRRPVVA